MRQQTPAGAKGKARKAAPEVPPSELRTRLEARRGEIEQLLWARVTAIGDPREAADPAYTDGLRRALASALDYGLQAIDREGHELPVPVELLAQARLAARNGIALDTVLRRYFAGYSLLGYILIEEASRDGLIGGAQLRRFLATQTPVFDRLLKAIGDEYERESASLGAFSSIEQVKQIERLLAGELVDTSSIPYDFGGWHLGLVASGPRAADAIRAIAHSLDLRALLVDRGREGRVWAWLGSTRRPDPVAVKDLAAADWMGRLDLAIGEPGRGRNGWRLSHLQAAAALPIAQRETSTPVRYSDIALVASVLQDDLLVESLTQLYLEPLKDGRDEGRVARQTLRAYIASGQNATSTAAALGVNRNTVASRLRAIEETLGRPLATCVAELDAALRVDESISERSWPSG